MVFAANVNPVTEPFLIDRVAAIAGDQNGEVDRFSVISLLTAPGTSISHSGPVKNKLPINTRRVSSKLLWSIAQEAQLVSDKSCPACI